MTAYIEHPDGEWQTIEMNTLPVFGIDWCGVCGGDMDECAYGSYYIAPHNPEWKIDLDSPRNNKGKLNDITRPEKPNQGRA